MIDILYSLSFKFQSVVDAVADTALKGVGTPSLHSEARRLREKRAEGDFWTASAIAQELAGALSRRKGVSVPPELDMSLGELLAAVGRLPELLAEIDRLAQSLNPDDVEAMSDDDALVEFAM